MSLPKGLVCEVPASILIRGTIPHASKCRMELTLSRPVTQTTMCPPFRPSSSIHLFHKHSCVFAVLITLDSK